MKIRKWLLALAGVFLLMQFFRIDKSVPATDPAMDLAAVTHPPEDVLATLKAACYDCHSYETRYPWYAEVAPVSWWLKNHVNEARHHFNFSTFGTRNDRQQLHAFKDAVETLEAGEMPMPSYTWIHKDAQLTDAQRTQLIAWFKGLNSIGSLDEQGK